MLVIPTIELQNGNCVIRPDAQSGLDQTTMFGDPVKMAKLWRVQNAKTLLVYDHDAAYSDRNNNGFIAAICQALDIPVMVAGGVRTAEDIETLLSMGAYQVVAEAQTPKRMEQVLRVFPSNRIAVHLNLTDENLRWGRETIDAQAYLAFLESLRCYRVLITARQSDGRARLDPQLYARLAQSRRRMRLTVSGGVNGFSDLNQIKALDRRVDSVMINRALYSGQFPCQAFWCWHQKELVDLDCFSSAPLRFAAKRPAA